MTPEEILAYRQVREKMRMEAPLKMKAVCEIYSKLKAAHENGGATFSDLSDIVTLCGCAAEKFAEAVHYDVHYETAAQRAEKFKWHAFRLQEQIRAMSLGATLCGVEDADTRKYSIDVLSFSFELYEKSLSSFFDFWEVKEEGCKIGVLDTICKRFNCLKLGFARNIPKV